MVYLSVIPAPRNFQTPFGFLEQVVNLTDTQPEHEKWIRLVTDALSMQPTAKKQFQVEIDVTGFKPEDLNVKFADGHVLIEGKHEDKRGDENSEDYMLRTFKRKIALPDNVIQDGLQCKLTADGKRLQVTAPLKVETPPEQQARTIPIQFEKAAPKNENPAPVAEGSAADAVPVAENVPATTEN